MKCSNNWNTCILQCGKIQEQSEMYNRFWDKQKKKINLNKDKSIFEMGIQQC